jgi:hypothetical protein
MDDRILEAFPDEREALRGLGFAVDELVSHLLGPTASALGWKNELSLSMVFDLRDRWLPLARLRLGMGDE